MKAYWDSSALVLASSDTTLRLRLRMERGFSRTHALAEIFSAFTSGNLAIRLDAESALKVIQGLAGDLDFIDLNADEVLEGLKDAKKKGVRGGRVHDFLHALAAEKAGAEELLTADRNDFVMLSTKVQVIQV